MINQYSGRLLCGSLAAALLLSGASRSRAEDLVVGAGERFQKIQDAIDAAVDGTDSVLVKAGTYAEAIDFKGKKIRVASTDGAATTIIDATAIPKTAVAAFKTAESDQSVLEGFTLTGGSGAPLNVQGTLLGGGGVFIDKATPTIRNCLIQKNKAPKGGGVLVQGIGGGGLLDGCEVSDNTVSAVAGQAGGGIAVTFTGTAADHLTLKDCRFLRNKLTSSAGAVQGGGGYLGGTNPQAKVILQNCTFSDNLIGTATLSAGEGGGAYLDTVLIEWDGGEVSGNHAMKGGGITVRNIGPASFVRNGLVKKNTTVAAGGGGGLSFPTPNTSHLTLSGLEVSENTSGTMGGGGILIEAGSPVIDGCRFLSNSTTQDGGAIRYLATGTKSKVNATLFQKNHAATSGGALYISSSSATQVVYSNCLFVKNDSTATGGAVFARAPAAGQVKFFYCTFYANKAGTGVGGFQADLSVNAQATLSNCILWANTPADYASDATSAAKISYSDVKLPATFPASRPGMLSLDPLFKAADADPADLHLQPGSPLIEKGSLGTDADGKPPAIDKDFDGKPRVADADGDGNAVPDLGAYEAEAGQVTGPRFIRGDANDDGGVDLSDAIGILQYQFLAGEKPKCMDAADADDTGAIDLSDPIFILNYLFLAGTHPPAPGPEACGVDPTADDLDPCLGTHC
jgi:predicted outer membrane repeat protein